MIRGHDAYERALASMVYKFFYKKTRSGISVNEQVTEKFYKSVIKRDLILRDLKTIIGQ